MLPFSFLGIEALIGCMGGHILGTIKAAKILSTTVKVSNKAVKAAKKCNAAIKYNK